MNVHLSAESRRFVADQVATGRYPSEEAVLEDALARMRQQPEIRAAMTQGSEQAPGATPENGAEPASATHKPIWEVFAEISASVPEEEWAKMPEDSSEQLDHYVYGVRRNS